MLRQTNKTRSLLLAGLLCCLGMNAWAGDIFEPPIRLTAQGEVIDTGEKFGHAGPHLGDIDGDGVRDLIVGSFNGKFRVFRNIGADDDPEFEAFTYLQAGGEDAKVWIYCCISSSPQLVDLDDDGHLDLISGSYDPGEFYLFRGLGDGKYASRETLADKNGEPILRRPDQQQDYQSFGSWISTADWENDGDLDLILGGFQGELFVRVNEGTRSMPVFATENVFIQIDGENAKVPGNHAALDVADWDGDGRWDIVSGSENGGVYWFRNAGTSGEPLFESPRELLPPHASNGFSDLVEAGEEPPVGIRTQVDVTDYNLDGKLDLLVGDFSGTVTPRPDLTPEEKEKLQSLIGQIEEVVSQRIAGTEALRKRFFAKYPGDLAFSEEADAQWSKDYQAWRDSDETKHIDEQYNTLTTATREFLLKSSNKTELEFGEYTTNHGHVWLFLRK